jgi:hypothetical protein
MQLFIFYFFHSTKGQACALRLWTQHTCPGFAQAFRGLVWNLAAIIPLPNNNIVAGSVL